MCVAAFKLYAAMVFTNHYDNMTTMKVIVWSSFDIIMQNHQVLYYCYRHNGMAEGTGSGCESVCEESLVTILDFQPPLPLTNHYGYSHYITPIYSVGGAPVPYDFRGDPFHSTTVCIFVDL